MDYRAIELLILQLEEAFSKSRSNVYSDTNKEFHFLEIYNVFNSIKQSDFKSFDQNNLEQHFTILNFIFKGLEYLDSSTLNVIPYEIISCLKYSLEDWIQNDNLIIVTSLSNNNKDFYFEAYYNFEIFKNINDYLKKIYKLEIKYRLIRISLPKVLSRDYLSMVVLYHELGHFIDRELNISVKSTYDKFGVKTQYSEVEMMYFNHQSEYFADLFASQYINDSVMTYLGYIASSNSDSQTHPSTAKRLNVVKDFLNKASCIEKDRFNNILSSSNITNLSIRHKKIDLNLSNFPNLIPELLNNEQELHYIFKLGWDFWENSNNNFLKDFEPRQKYQIINNLIEKSISNFTNTKRWLEVSTSIN